MKKFKLKILVPVSITVEISGLREKTSKIGQIGRSLAVFRVDEVSIYNDYDPDIKNPRKEASLIEVLLQYMETPQYLRKRLFPYMKELRYAGLLPPLRTPHHPLEEERNERGDIREAAVIDSKKGESRLDLGLPMEGVLKEELEEKTRITVKIEGKIDEDRVLVRRVDKKDIDDYWGFEINRVNSLAQGIGKAKVGYNLGTSRYGQNWNEVVETVKEDTKKNIVLVFGGPNQGLFEICKKQGDDPNSLFDVIVNTIPNQGTKTVRTEEALTSTLAILNIELGKK